MSDDELADPRGVLQNAKLLQAVDAASEIATAEPVSLAAITSCHDTIEAADQGGLRATLLSKYRENLREAVVALLKELS